MDVWTVYSQRGEKKKKKQQVITLGEEASSFWSFTESVSSKSDINFPLLIYTITGGIVKLSTIQDQLKTTKDSNSTKDIINEPYSLILILSNFRAAGWNWGNRELIEYSWLH